MVRSLICTCIWRDTEGQEVEGNNSSCRDILRNASSQENTKVTKPSSYQYSRTADLWQQSFHQTELNEALESVTQTWEQSFFPAASVAFSPLISRISNWNTHKPGLQMIYKRTVGKMYFSNSAIIFSFDRLKNERFKSSNNMTSQGKKKKYWLITRMISVTNWKVLSSKLLDQAQIILLSKGQYSV